jgi:hypothetical protein
VPSLTKSELHVLLPRFANLDKMFATKAHIITVTDRDVVVIRSGSGSGVGLVSGPGSESCSGGCVCDWFWFWVWFWVRGWVWVGLGLNLMYFLWDIICVAGAPQLRTDSTRVRSHAPRIKRLAFYLSAVVDEVVIDVQHERHPRPLKYHEWYPRRCIQFQSSSKSSHCRSLLPLVANPLFNSRTFINTTMDCRYLSRHSSCAFRHNS